MHGGQSKGPCNVGLKIDQFLLKIIRKCLKVKQKRVVLPNSANLIPVAIRVIELREFCGGRVFLLLLLCCKVHGFYSSLPHRK